jgi:hypothetical protein
MLHKIQGVNPALAPEAHHEVCKRSIPLTGLVQFMYDPVEGQIVLRQGNEVLAVSPVTRPLIRVDVADERGWLSQLGAAAPAPARGNAEPVPEPCRPRTRTRRKKE